MVHEMCMKHVTVACIYFVLYFLQHSGLHFRHTDNTVQWLRAMESVGLPKVRSKYTLFLLSTIFDLFFSHTTQHNIQKTTKQNNRHILNISRSNQKGGGEGRTTKTQKLLLYIITYIQQKTLPSINGRRPGPTNSRRCTFTWDNLQEAADPICFSTHVWCKPVLDYCLLHSCKTSKQHSLLHWTNTETRIIIKCR